MAANWNSHELLRIPNSSGSLTADRPQTLHKQLNLSSCTLIYFLLCGCLEGFSELQINDQDNRVIQV